MDTHDSKDKNRGSNTTKVGHDRRGFSNPLPRKYRRGKLFCVIGLKGSVRDELMATLQSALDKAESIQKAESVPSLNITSSGAGGGGGGMSSEEAKSSIKEGGKSESISMPPNTSESMRDLTKRLRTDGVGDMPGNIFDKAESVIMEALRRESWATYQQSEWFTKLRNFLWYQDRGVVPEDFFVMRVLGRGGFGSVTVVTVGDYRCEGCVLSFQFPSYSIILP